MPAPGAAASEAAQVEPVSCALATSAAGIGRPAGSAGGMRGAGPRQGVNLALR